MRICILALSLATVFAQTPAPLAFEVASIKPAGPLNPAAIQSGKMRIGMKMDGAICSISSLSMKDLVRIAYEVKDYQVTGDDASGALLTAERFNIQATLPAGATEKQVPEMLRTLLADRFKLVVHKDTKEHSVYGLVVGKGGSKLKEAEPDPPVTPDPDAPASQAKGSDEVHFSGNMEGGKGVTVQGGTQGPMHMAMVDGKMRLEASKMTMAGLCEVLSRFLDRPVVDMTELKGGYQVRLDLSMDDLKSVARSMGAMMGGGKPSDDPTDPPGASIVTSVQQMGLKLDPRKEPLPVIVIDHVEKMPTDN